MAESNPTQTAKARRSERFTHALWAGAVALVLSFIALFEPLDSVVWATQDRMAAQDASGDIVLVSSDTNLADPDFPERRSNLAAVIRQLDAAGVEAVYIDQVFERPSDPVSDGELNAALRNFSGDAFLVSKVRTNATGASQIVRTDPSIGTGVQEVASRHYTWYAGFVWDATYYVEQDGLRLPNLGMHLAGVEERAGESFFINYGFKRDSIPAYAARDLILTPDLLSAVDGKTVVITGAGADQVEEYSIPGLTNVRGSLIHIYAAETLMAGRHDSIPVLLTLFVFIALLLGAAWLQSRKLRRVLYLAMCLGLPIIFVVTAYAGVRVWLTDIAVMLALFGALRGRASWKSSFALIDAETNLPTFAALETERQIAETLPGLIVAKIHRFEQVKRTLPKELHGEYILRIIARLKAATQDATIYRGEGNMIAWAMDEKDPGLLQEHLEGLRALFASPLIVGEAQVDVGITFGVDITPSPNVARRLAAAVAAAEHTNETYDPIAIADSTSEEDLIWNISLQARIDAALSSGEIYLAYQPKIMVQTGEIIGVEALVRWKDPVKGHIPPDNFIRQCETAGRMSHLTRFVLEEACKAGNAFAARGLNIQMAVNISATLVHERAIVQMVSDVLTKTGFEPRSLTLEITETYRISNIDRAAEVLDGLHRLGAKISMDDFGVGAASYEALLRLPFDELKIDRMFVARMATEPKAQGIVQNILRLGKDLRIIVVAEGVEDAGTLRLLRDSGCLVAQGYGISRPVEFDRILEFQSDSAARQRQNMV
ncbi:EAL domain-containing protein [Erythrobacter sp. EC-HK427]|uniref:EAL domain-containing protein n=1 Tax=Erythrobacter sp. EC-HK427 TaxID=2038396 RepID=UPI00125BF1D0|nr:EAL domain-containing protein [Erythrobacter sp. EC-HK427]VVS99762.1 Diguanylate phosphodiesterase [Erythrobacter sp. EC-HK427]